MIKEILLSGFILVCTVGFGQINFSTIDEKSKTVPDSLNGYKEIADYLTNDLKTEKEKARAIYIWIAYNIEYDLGQVNSSKRYNSDKEIIDEVLNDRKGLCQHYSELFLAMSNSIGLKSYLISGYTKDVFGRIASVSHSWNGIYLDSNYYMIDVTWASGYKINGKYVHKFRDNYFLRSPKEFIKDHMPFDPIWQFLDNPINNSEFISADFTKLDIKGGYAFEDLILQFEMQNELDQLESMNNRIIANGIKNSLIQEQVDENILQITNRKYNLAIDTLNYGIDNYNLYISHKNRQFRNPKIEDHQVKELIENADKGIYAANEILYGLFSSNYELDKLISETRSRIPDLISDLNREKNFVDRYLKKWKPFRIFMFYSYGY